MPRVLVVDDDPDLRALVVVALGEAGMEAVEAADGASALEAAASKAFDVVVLDVGLGGMDGFEVCRALRATSDVPVVFLTSRSEEVDELVGFAMGGTDYVTKPFSPRVLVARVRAALRPRPPQDAPGNVLEQGALRLDLDARTLAVSGEPVDLTRTEFDLLAVLMAASRRVVPRDELLDRVWGSTFAGDNLVEVHVSRLRAKIVAAGGPRVPVSVRSVGYRLGLDS